MATPVSNVVGLTGDARIDGLVQGSAWRFDGSGTLLTYSLSHFIIAFDRSWDDLVELRVAPAFAEWAKVANLTFAESGSNTPFYQSTADIALTPTHNDELDAGPGVVALGLFPSPAFANDFLAAAEATRADYPRPEGDIFLNQLDPVFDSPFAGSPGFAILLHEIGHALGLKHPYDDGGNDRPTFEQLGIQSYAAERYTLMSLGPNIDPRYGHASTPMPLDILAIQRIYGANMSYRTGNDEYTTHTVQIDGGRYMRTIWDAGGYDTLGVPSATTGLTVDLRPGSITEYGDGTVLAIAYNTIIERAFGGAGNDRLIGNDADNEFHGSGGIDSLEGGAGNDTYYTNVGSTVIERPNEGVDVVQAGNAGFVLPANVENLVLGWGAFEGTGNELANRLTGNAFEETLRGMAGDDYLDGGGHGDTLIGGAGNDTYVVDTNRIRTDGVPVFDSVIESADEGIDTVRALVTFSLSPNVENLILASETRIDGIGNDLPNEITGNAFANALYGGAGADTLIGEGGDDALYGGAGADIMRGGAGDDIYEADNVGDNVIEAAGQGTDTVRSAVTFALGTGLENLVLTGLALGGTGNELDNRIEGNAADNLLFGGLGNDTLVGGAGDDAARYGGPRSAYTIEDNDGSVIVSGAEGRDTLTEIERVEFADALVSLRGGGLLDLGADGRSDILWSHTGGTVGAWLGGAQANGQGLGALAGNWSLVEGHGDYDGDGRSDILWRHTDGTVGAWLGGAQANGQGLGALATSWRIVDGHADFNGDGRSDLLWRNADGTLGTWLGGAQANGQGLGALSASWSIFDTHGDYNADGRSDILWRHTDGTVGTWLGGAQSNGQGLGALSTSWSIVDGHGDYNGDGRSDILWRHTDGTVGTWLGGAQATGQGLGALPTSWRIVDGHGDYNGDGRSDILWRHTDGTVGTWLGGAQSTGQGLGALATSWSIVDGHGDYNGDGRSDILWRHADGTIGTWLGGAQANGQALGVIPSGWSISDAAEMGGAIRSGGGSTSGTVGRDTLYGSAASDTLTGGAGADRFAFDTALNAATNVDTISDFTPGADKLLLSEVIFAGPAPGALAAGNFVGEAGAVAHDANDFILYDTATGALSYDVDGSGVQAAINFAILSNRPLLAATDVQIGWF